MKNGNGYATKIDLKKLEGKMDHRFEQVDKRFEQVDKRFEQVDKRFEQVDKRFEQVDKRFSQIDKKLGKIDMRLGIFHFEWDAWKQDALTEFNSQWITRIDPILADIERHREQEVIWAEENRQTKNAVHKLENKVDNFGKKLDAIAKKIGV